MLYIVRKSIQLAIDVDLCIKVLVQSFGTGSTPQDAHSEYLKAVGL